MSSAMVVAPWSVTAQVPHVKGPAPFMCKSLPEAMATSLLSVTAPVPEAKVPAPVMCKSLPEAMATSPLSVTAPVPVEKVPVPEWAKAVWNVEVPVLPLAPTVKADGEDIADVCSEQPDGSELNLLNGIAGQWWH